MTERVSEARQGGASAGVKNWLGERDSFARSNERRGKDGEGWFKGRDSLGDGFSAARIREEIGRKEG